MSSWTTVKSKAEDKKKRQEERRKEVEGAKAKDRLGVALQDPVLAAFDRAYATKSAPGAAQARPGHGAYAGAFAGLENEQPPAALQQRGRAAGSSSGASSRDSSPGAAVADGDHAAASSSIAGAQRAKKPKVKKPKVTVAQVAAGLDVVALDELFTQLRSRYASSQADQLGVLADYLLKAFKEAHLEFNKALTDKGPLRAAGIPIRDVPASLVASLSGFICGCSTATLVQVLPDLVAATFEGLPDGSAAGAAAAAAQPPKPKVGLLLLLAVMLRARPEVIVAAAPALAAAGRLLSAPGPRLSQLLWLLQQAGEAQPEAAVAAWVRVLLPQALGAAELPTPPSKSSPKAAANGGEGGSGRGAATAPASGAVVKPLDTASVGQALEYLEAVLAAAPTTGVIAVGTGREEAVVPGAAVELLSRAAFPGQGAAAAAAGSVGKRGGATAGPHPGLAPMHGQLATLAAAGASAPGAAGDWLALTLESASASSAPLETPDALVLRSARATVACLAASDAAFGVWESKHKQQLRGSARVLVALAQQPALLAPLSGKGVPASKRQQLRALAGTLPVRHRAYLVAGKGWQGVCARAAEDACTSLSRGARLGGGSSCAGGAGSGALLGALSVAVAVSGVLASAALYRREVGGLVAHYAGADAARQLDSAMLAPLQDALLRAQEAAAPHVAAARAATEPQLAALQAAATPHLAKLSEAAAPLLAQAREAVAPLLAQGREAAAYLQQQLEEIWQHAKEG